MSGATTSTGVRSAFSQRVVHDQVGGWCETCEKQREGSAVSVRNWADHHSRFWGHTVKTMRTTVRCYQPKEED